jgi:hypothetical protein
MPLAGAGARAIKSGLLEEALASSLRHGKYIQARERLAAAILSGLPDS